jgi:hypothetical protein
LNIFVSKITFPDPDRKGRGFYAVKNPVNWSNPRTDGLTAQFEWGRLK